MSSVISTAHLTRKFLSTEAVHDLNLEVPEASIFGYLGPNGAGKTTTIKTLMNIFVPSSGSARVLGLDSRRLSASRLQRIGYVSENQELPEWMSVDFYLDYCRAFYPDWDPALCEVLVKQFDLPRKQKLKQLSRGMKMKAALVSAIAYRPQLLVLDEPFSGLDPLVRDELVEGILAISAEHRWTVFVSSHDLAEIENLVTHVAFIDRGHLQFSEELASLQNRFREVEITRDEVAAMPSPWYEGWLNPESSGAVVRFIVADYSEDRTPQQLKAMFPSGRNLSVQPMSLRAIFINLAKSHRRVESTEAQ
ncbi:MAG TPA: ABC transporter ATP-binding protein [Dongiaceae bacterium]|nr:ABC transporter ATP-binding protein [Dongiaceae bacterium]